MAKLQNTLLGPVSLASALALGWAGAACSTDRDRTADAPPAETVHRGRAPEAQVRPPEPRQINQAFAGVAERLAPSVVRITTRGQSPAVDTSPGSGGDSFEGTPFERFFEDFGRRPAEPPGPRFGMGSGVVIDAQGHILTNNHLVAHMDEVRVTFIDGEELPGKIVGTDPKTDLAVLKVDDASAKAAEFGSAERLRVGEWVMAIGNPFGLDHSVTVGVLSAKGRYGLAPGKLEDFLQTDASINPGNSGGPLVNLSGQVIGINTMIAGLGTGVGFAVSESIARPIARQLIEHGKVIRPYIGLAMQPLTPVLRQALGDKPPEKGALVAQVQKGSPAEKSGVQAGDVVVAVNGEPTADSREVQQAFLEQEVGGTVEVTVWRDGEERKLGVRTTELPSDSVAVGEPRGGDKQLGLGLALATLTPPLAERLGLDRAAKGVIVTAVHPEGAAADAGLRGGDVLVDIDRKPVATADEAAKRLKPTRPGGHLARVRRGNASLFVAIPNPRAES